MERTLVTTHQGQRSDRSHFSTPPITYFPTRLPLEPLLVMLCWLEGGVMLGCQYNKSRSLDSRCRDAFIADVYARPVPFSRPTGTVVTFSNVLRAAGSSNTCRAQGHPNCPLGGCQSSMRLTHSRCKPPAPRLPWIRKPAGTGFVGENMQPLQTGRSE